AKTGRGEDKDDKGSRESPSEIVGSKECACLILTPPESDCFSSLRSRSLFQFRSFDWLRSEANKHLGEKHNPGRIRA
ncbi:MAG: hypothetical protein WCF61_07470, partial [Terriglobales bacterium]